MEEKGSIAKKKRITPSPINDDLGRRPPQALDLEEAVLGALLLDRGAVNDAIDILQPESFYKDAHQVIFECIRDLFHESQPIDVLTVTQALRKKKSLDFVGGPYYLSQLTNRVASSANVEFHARIVAQKYIQRELIRVSSETIKKAYDESSDVLDLLDEAEADLFSVAEGNLRKNYAKMTDLIKEAIEQIEKAAENTDGVNGVPSGFTELDRVTSGWQKGDMVVIAARPGMGKTAFVLSMARNIAVDHNRPIALFSLEMSSLQLVNRLISSETEISAEKLRKGNLEQHEYTQLHERLKKMANAPIFIDDTPGLSVFELRAKCRRLKAQHDIDLVVIDYLQLMSAGGSKGNREQEISTISRSIKSIAMELNIPVIALSQLSRSVETRGGDKRPMLSDLRESGAIEQDADIVTFIYRPEYYGFLEDEDGNSVEGMGEIMIAKHRNGALENVKLKFTGHLAKFSNLNSFDKGFGDPAVFQGAGDGFDAGSPMTRSSKMNEFDTPKGGGIQPGGNFDNFSNDNDDEVPF
ncbi:MAG: replicative DNA helicase [Sphingobacteriales bacterium]|jgi:replicative DNA helicase